VVGVADAAPLRAALVAALDKEAVRCCEGVRREGLPGECDGGGRLVLEAQVGGRLGQLVAPLRAHRRAELQRRRLEALGILGGDAEAEGAVLD